MKIQNLTIIFLVITIPLVMISSYFINLQSNTLKLQAEYDLKLSEATKEAIKAYEINTVDWSALSAISERTQVEAMINAFISSLTNKLNIAGTAKEYMLNYIPAIAVTMYDGYYIYAPSKVPVNWENKDGVQLYLDSANNVTTDGTGNNAPLYIAKAGYGSSYRYKKIDENGRVIEDKTQRVTTKIKEASEEYKYILNSKIAYTDIAKNNSSTNLLNLVVNYTLDNRVYVYGTKNGEYIAKTGCLVYFDSYEELPKITITNGNISRINHSIVNTIYSKTEENGIANKTIIEPETLEEQIVYYDNNSSIHSIGTFKYLYDIKHKKLYYDEARNEFFRLTTNNRRVYLGGKDNTEIKVGDENCFYKSVSVLVEDGGKGEKYKKIYQVLNGKDQGKWYISSIEYSDVERSRKDFMEEIDIKLEDDKVQLLGLTYKNDEYSVDYSPIYKDYSAINYYVESYAFTNWVNNSNLKLSNGEQLKVTRNNNPEKDTSNIVQGKKQVIIDNINKNLNLAISNYGHGANKQFQLPVLTENDWEQVLKNISLLTFFQGVPIELKTYNGYSFATSTTNRAFVDPGELYFMAAGDNDYHRVYCKETDNITYTGYRSVEYVLKEYPNFDPSGNAIYYYEHDEYTNITDKNCETACYYCTVNRSNYTQIENGNTDSSERTYKQAKSYNEALARERYNQKESLDLKDGITVNVIKNSLTISDTEILIILDNSGSMNEFVKKLQEDTCEIIDKMFEGKVDKDFYLGALTFATYAVEIGEITKKSELEEFKNLIRAYRAYTHDEIVNEQKRTHTL